MTSPLGRILSFAMIPVAASIVGGTAAALRPPAAVVRSYLQHFAAGVVFAALAVEILPDVVHRRAPVAAAVGFALGVAAMLALRALSGRVAAEDGGGGGGSDGGAGGRAGEAAGARWGLVLVIGVDVLLDGVLLGVGFNVGEKAGTLLAIALGVELLSLGVVTATELGRGGLSRRRVVAVNALLSLLPLVGAAAGATLLAGLSNGWMEGWLSFAAAALLYLVTEELLVEAHEVPETPLATATFFAGFLLLLVLDMVA